MAKKHDNSRNINVAVVGLSGTEKEKGAVGVGKSCLCNRFMRFLADDYNVDHISVLSQSDFSGRIVNNDHFLYWGDVTKTSEDGIDFTFQVIEQTEFIDDSSFQSCTGGKMDPYVKRCISTKITSAEKLMYICKNQLGIEKEYEQKTLPDGKFNVDGFLCVFDVSVVHDRSIEQQLETVTNILINIIKIKRPVVLVTTKNDELNESYVQEIEKLLARKEFKGMIPMIETSAHQNINVDSAFIALANLIDKKGRTKIVPYLESVRLRKDFLDHLTDQYQALIQHQITDYRAVWSQSLKKLSNCNEFLKYKEEFGIDKTQRIFRKHVKFLRDKELSVRIQNYTEMLPNVFQKLLSDMTTLKDGDWSTVQNHILNHPNFNHYFYKCPDDIPWIQWELDFEKCYENNTGNTKLIPSDILNTYEAETIFKNYIDNFRLKLNKELWKNQFKEFLQDVGYVSPGKRFNDVKVLFMGVECFERLSNEECDYIYNTHQKNIIEKAKINFQELLLEYAELFYHFKSLAPRTSFTQEDIKLIIDNLKHDTRFKTLDNLDQDRKLMIFQHLNFVNFPIKEHCPAYSDCIDVLIENILFKIFQGPTTIDISKETLPKSENNLHLVILGSNDLTEKFSTKLKSLHSNNNKYFEFNNQSYNLKYQLINSDINLSKNSFQTSDFIPNGCVCLFSNSESFEYIRNSLEKTLLYNLEKDDKLPFQGLPIILLYINEFGMGPNKSLQEDGQSLAHSLQCPFIFGEMEALDIFNEHLIYNAITLLIENITRKNGYLNEYQSIINPSEPDIRIIMCMLCGDSYSIEAILTSLLNNDKCYLNGSQSIILETILENSKIKIEIILCSYHGANSFRDELIHGFILVYYDKRKASLSTLNGFSSNCFSTNSTKIPIQIIAISEATDVHNNISKKLLEEGCLLADRLKAHFVSITTSNDKSFFSNQFFQEVWDKKSEVENAFHIYEPSNFRNINSLSKIEYSKLNQAHDIRSGIECSFSLTHSQENLMNESDESDICLSENTQLHNTNNNMDKLGGSGYFQVFPVSVTPPEPAPPDIGIFNYNTPMIASNSSLDEFKSINGSRESLILQDSDSIDDSVFMKCPDNKNSWINNYSKHAFTTGRQISKSRLKNSHYTMKKPGKLNMNNFTQVTDALSKINLISNNSHNCGALLKPDNLISPEYDIDNEPQLFRYQNDKDYAYLFVQDELSTSFKHKFRHCREKGISNYSDSDNDNQGSSEIPESLYNSSNDKLTKLSRKSISHNRSKKNSAIPVSTPKVPFLNGSNKNISFPAEQLNNYPENLDKNAISKPSILNNINCHDENVIGFCRSYRMQEKNYNFEEESNLDVKSPNSNLKNKSDIKYEKEKMKFEKKHKKLAAEKNKKKNKKNKNTAPPIINCSTLENFVQSKNNVIPLLLEKCIQFIETEGLNSEGLYRVPGNRSHVDILFQQFEEDNDINILNLDIPVNAVATALKDFFSKKLPPLFTDELIDELEDLSVKADRNCRLIALRNLLQKLPNVNFEILKYIFHHLVRVSENCKVNSMDSKNLSICWWPTILRIEFHDMSRFELLRPHLEDIVQIMIDQYPFLFCGKDAFVMV